MHIFPIQSAPLKFNYELQVFILRIWVYSPGVVRTFRITFLDLLAGFDTVGQWHSWGGGYFETSTFCPPWPSAGNRERKPWKCAPSPGQQDKSSVNKDCGTVWPFFCVFPPFCRPHKSDVRYLRLSLLGLSRLSSLNLLPILDIFIPIFDIPLLITQSAPRVFFCVHICPNCLPSFQTFFQVVAGYVWVGVTSVLRATTSRCFSPRIIPPTVQAQILWIPAPIPRAYLPGFGSKNCGQIYIC